MPSFQTVEKVSFQQDIALNQLPKAHIPLSKPQRQRRNILPKTA